MSEVKVYGASDDLIEIDGDVVEEFTWYTDDEPAYLGFSDGTVLRIIYDKTALWKIMIINKGTATVEKVFEATDSDGDEYSDIVVLKDEKIDWVMFASKFVKSKEKKC